jgi:hypothetical protein
MRERAIADHRRWRALKNTLAAPNPALPAVAAPPAPITPPRIRTKRASTPIGTPPIAWIAKLNEIPATQPAGTSACQPVGQTAARRAAAPMTTKPATEVTP